MLKASLAGAAILFAQQASPAQPVRTGCTLRIGVAIACIGNDEDTAENAADLFSIYGLDKPKIMTDAAGDYVQRFGCLRAIGDVSLQRVGSTTVATPDAEIPVVFGILVADKEDRRPFVAIAEPYITGNCSPPKTN